MMEGGKVTESNLSLVAISAMIFGTLPYLILDKNPQVNLPTEASGVRTK